ncbi:DNA repair metallo-beta-lactamase [Macleaya cordata]|uniref:Protein artemis n=1 Tax=Macleaya cordata TaxID=56857 RepID=A0A200QRW4_MACCD|nr:DNA repair metallo-beta-lactamase [Macleaya cordata]
MEKGMISVDRWSESSQVYFLTHLHADHTKGLSSNWNRGPIFCSPITAKLFPVKFPGLRLSLIRVLEIGSLYSLPLVSPSTGSQTIIQVTAIDAHHCPGAVMYLFRGEFGCMLFTGDFRWEGTTERALIGKSMLLNALGGEKVDFLYLDNTYCNPSYSFPPREVVAQQVVKIIASHPEHDVIIAINTLGKEDLLLHISRTLNTKIWVWPERLQIMHLLGFHDIFTTKTSLTRVRAVPFYSFSINTLEELNSIRPTIGIMPSGLPWVVRPLDENDPSLGSSLSTHQHISNCNTNRKDQVNRNQQIEELSSVRKFHQYIYTVPYSDHSCFDELQDFIKLVQPLNMRGIVSSSSCYIDPLYYFRDLHGQNESAKQSSNKFQQRKINGNVEKLETKSSNVCHTIHMPVKSERTRKAKAGYLGVHMSKVSILRRRSRGVKIVEIDGVD